MCWRMGQPKGTLERRNSCPDPKRRQRLKAVEQRLSGEESKGPLLPRTLISAIQRTRASSAPSQDFLVAEKEAGRLGRTAQRPGSCQLCRVRPGDQKGLRAENGSSLTPAGFPCFILDLMSTGLS